MDLQNALGKAMTGRRSQKVTNRAVLEISKGAFRDEAGSEKTWKELAQETGVSERTMRRIRAGGTPSKSTQGKLDQLRGRREVRQAAMKPKYRRKLDKAAAQGASVKIRADQGPRGKGHGDYRRMRDVTCQLPSEVMQELLEAYEGGDDERAAELLEDAISEHGWDDWNPNGWSIGDVEELDIE